MEEEFTNLELEQNLLRELGIVLAMEFQEKQQNRDDLLLICQDANGPMQSTHDTTRQASGWLLNALYLYDIKIQKAFETLIRSINERTNNENNFGYVLTFEELHLTKELDDKNDFFFSVPEGLGGREFSFDGDTYLTISTQSKILKSLL